MGKLFNFKLVTDGFKETSEKMKDKKLVKNQEKEKKLEEKLNKKIQDKTIKAKTLINLNSNYDPLAAYDKKLHALYNKRREEIIDILSFLVESSKENYERLQVLFEKNDPFLRLKKEIEEVEEVPEEIVDSNQITSKDVEQLQLKCQMAEMQAALNLKEHEMSKQQTLLMQEEIIQNKMKMDAEIELVELQIKLKDLKNKLNGVSGNESSEE